VAVYERAYHPYAGGLTPAWSRFLVIPRHAYRDVFRKRLFVAFFAACFVWPLLLAVLIYLPHNLGFLKLMAEGTTGEIFGIKFNATFFMVGFVGPQGGLAFLMTFVLAPGLISSDLRNNALPLYLARPFSRWEYILGKTVVLVPLLSLVTWVPGLLLFLLQAYLAGGRWILDNVRIGFAICLASWIHIAVLCLVSLAISAYVKWKPLARLGLFAVFIVAAGLSQILNLALRTSWGSVLHLAEMERVVWASLFGVELGGNGVPVPVAWLSLLGACAMCILLLARRVRAYDVVK
jgi:ABC-2 type transport system permease protein